MKVIIFSLSFLLKMKDTMEYIIVQKDVRVLFARCKKEMKKENVDLIFMMLIHVHIS